MLPASQARGRLFKCFQAHLVKLRLHPYLLQGPVLLFSTLVAQWFVKS